MAMKGGKKVTLVEVPGRSPADAKDFVTIKLTSFIVYNLFQFLLLFSTCFLLPLYFLFLFSSNFPFGKKWWIKIDFLPHFRGKWSMTQMQVKIEEENYGLSVLPLPSSNSKKIPVRL